MSFETELWRTVKTKRSLSTFGVPFLALLLLMANLFWQGVQYFKRFPPARWSLAIKVAKIKLSSSNFCSWASNIAMRCQYKHIKRLQLTHYSLGVRFSGYYGVFSDHLAICEVDVWGQLNTQSCNSLHAHYEVKRCLRKGGGKINTSER